MQVCQRSKTWLERRDEKEKRADELFDAHEFWASARWVAREWASYGQINSLELDTELY